MALRLRTKWHQTKRVRKGKANRAQPKTLADRGGVVGFNIWKIALQTFKNMEKEDFRFASDEQATATLTEIIAFLVQIVDRMVYQQLDESERGELINMIGVHLAKTMETNMKDLFGPGEYRQAFIDTLNQRFADYAECEYTAEGPGYAFKRYLADKISDILAQTDNKWVVEHVMEIELPEAVKSLQRLVRSSLGIQ